MEPLLCTRGLKKYFKVSQGWLHAVDNVDMEIYQGKTLGVVGESGCGKSTLGRLVLRLIEPTTGEIIFRGENILQRPSREMGPFRQKMQIIFQDPYASLDPRMSVYDIIAEPLVMNRIYSNKNDLERRVEELMDTVGLAERFMDVYPHEMDGGRRQRVGVARALALNPDFIVCDEPVSALDVSIQAQILNLLMDLQDKFGFTYMFITHNLAVVKHISDEIMVMYLGMCVERTRSSELFRNPLHPYTQGLLKAIPSIKLGSRHTWDIIAGEVGNPVNPKPGCRFAPRCPLVMNKCHGTNIELVENSEGHWVACRLYD